MNKEEEETKIKFNNPNISSNQRTFPLIKSLTLTQKINIKSTLKTMKQLKNNNENKYFQINPNKLIRYYLFCFCLRNRKNNEKEILEKGMELFSTKMDIFNLFKESVKIEPLLKKYETINIYNNLDINN